MHSPEPGVLGWLLDGNGPRDVVLPGSFLLGKRKNLGRNEALRFQATRDKPTQRGGLANPVWPCRTAFQRGDEAFADGEHLLGLAAAEENRERSAKIQKRRSITLKLGLQYELFNKLRNFGRWE